ncbi:DUF58 domain-containing protein [Scytonema sp. UIC 10036]|uniref:DUF58 domain-containing protein n=1 Tax=Scytonema sp. UIC 10036 TaxID=2304196 RepID=UPI0012DA65C5|nr:DUF58 domain-containing protein [Scytonema sp. UIC 10036]MUG95850.1 DUF58 domain-containing protein [Scytonema sp. UIC 10036]
MKIIKNITNWLETRACAPAYSGWILMGIAICFFGAGINTMAGWLYVISGVSFALLGLAVILPPRSLLGLVVKRLPIEPVTAGDDLTVELEIFNQARQPASLLQVQDMLPFVLGKPIQTSIERIPDGESYRWVYHQPTQRRGIFRWQTVELGSGAPLGLFWCRRLRDAAVMAIVYPKVLPLTSCPLIDEMGDEDSQRGDPRGKPLQTATQGLTRCLRPYHIGDPIRMIHWRTSARYGELRVRELELITGGQEIIIAIDSAGNWNEENFEQAVIAAASLYFYAHRQQMQLALWTASTGVIRGQRVVQEALAAIAFHEDACVQPPHSPLIWLTQNPLTLSSLPTGSRWILWQDVSTVQEQVIVNKDYLGIQVDAQQPLQIQLQKSIR